MFYKTKGKKMNIDRKLKIIIGVNQLLLDNWGDVHVRAKIFEKYSKEDIQSAIEFFENLAIESPKQKRLKNKKAGND